MGFDCLWLGACLGRFRFAVADCADCATSQLLVLALVLVPLKMATSRYRYDDILDRSYFPELRWQCNDAPDDSVVVVQYSSSSHIGTGILAPSFSRCIVIFHRHGSIIRGCGRHDVQQRSTDALGGRSEDKDVRGIQERTNHQLVRSAAIVLPRRCRCGREMRRRHPPLSVGCHLAPQAAPTRCLHHMPNHWQRDVGVSV